MAKSGWHTFKLGFQAPSKAQESWWVLPMTREAFEAAVRRELPRMEASRIGRLLSARGNSPEYDIIE